MQEFIQEIKRIEKNKEPLILEFASESIKEVYLITNFLTIHTWHKNLAKIIRENFFSIFTTSFGCGPKIKKQITNKKTNNYGKKINSIEI